MSDYNNSARGMGTLPPRLPSASVDKELLRSSSRSQTHQNASELSVQNDESRQPHGSVRGNSSGRSRSSSRGPRGQSSERSRSSSRNRHSSSSGNMTSGEYEPTRRSRSKTDRNSRARSAERIPRHQSRGNSSRPRSLSRSSYEPSRSSSTTDRVGRTESREIQYMEDTFKPRCRSRSSSRGRSRRSVKNPISAAIPSDQNATPRNAVTHGRPRSSGRRKTTSFSEKVAQTDNDEPSEWLPEETPPERNPDYAPSAGVSANGTTAAQRNPYFDGGDESSSNTFNTEKEERERYDVVAAVVVPNGVDQPQAAQDGYDFTPLGDSPAVPSPHSHSPIDPWATSNANPIEEDSYSIDDNSEMMDSKPDPVDAGYESAPSGETTIETFLTGADIHPNMMQSEEDIAQLRLFAGKLSADWGGEKLMAPALARRIRDFQYAQDKRRRKYGDERPWGILGLYDHLSGIRVDVEWAEDAAWRRSNGEPYLSWADFEASKKKGINRPFFTYFILFVCTITTIVSIGLNGWKVEPFDQNPMIGPSAETLIRMGAKDSYLIVHESESWRLVSSIILHAGLIHYFVNMLALWFVGAAIETSHGFIATTMVFTIPAVGGTILSAIFLPDHITVGASGGIFGLIGACLADILSNWKLLFNDFVTENGKKHHHILVLVFLVLDIILNTIIGLTPYVDNFTHLGGMAYGFLCGISTMERVSSDFFGMSEGIWKRTKHIVVRFFGLIVSLIVIVVTLIILLEGDGETTPCPDCTWLSCVPFPPWADNKDKWWYCDDCGVVTAEIISEPELHMELKCPSGASVDVPLTEDDIQSTKKLEKKLPDYCREFCPDVESRFRF